MPNIKKLNNPLSMIKSFLSHSAAGGIMLIGAAALALIFANSPLKDLYFNVLHIDVGGLPVLHWINDGLMTVFFLMVGLELKREILEGQLSTWSRRALPGFAALGGILVPALIYLAFNRGANGHLGGWAIPAATDIAFALGVLSLLGSRVPLTLRIFLTALAIIDDMGAIIVIALFYTGAINESALGLALLTVGALITLNRLRVMNLWPYLLLGIALWYFVLQSGVHATLAGVVLALCIPLRTGGDASDNNRSPLHTLERGIASWVAFLIVPLFGFANAGISFGGLSVAHLFHPIPLGIALGLFFGKQIGVFAFSAGVIRLGWAEMPAQASWPQLYGVSILCGIGFTMSLFIGLLAFPGNPMLQNGVKLGVLIGSIVSALIGAVILCRAAASAKAPGKG